MSLNLNSIMIGSEEPKRLTDYYTLIFGEPTWNEGGYLGWQFGNGGIAIGAHDQVKGSNPQPGRLLWNLETPDVAGEFARLKKAGAIVVQEPYRPDEAADMWVATFADPEDNYFQLVSPM